MSILAHFTNLMAALSFVVVVMSCELNKGKTADNFQVLLKGLITTSLMNSDHFC